jgi:hypothetical protein
VRLQVIFFFVSLLTLPVPLQEKKLEKKIQESVMLQVMLILLNKCFVAYLILSSQ